MATQDSRQSGSEQADSGQGAHGLGPGSVVGGTWIVERLLGKGGMGAVWLARHQRLSNKRCAIKVLLGTGLRDEAYVRFAREAEIATRIGHPNIVDVLDLAALESGEPYIVLEYLQGEVLRDRLRRKGSLSWPEVVAITRQIGSALLAAHRHEVVHRDLKPENIFLVPTDSGGTIRDHVKVLDFGISKLRGSQTLQTQEAVLLGTPQYMAPEQASGRNNSVDGRSDQFALAVMVYEMLTGTPPWVADTPLGLLFQVVHAPTPALPAHLTQVPQHAVAAIEKALAKQADDRFADVGAFVEALTGEPLHFLTNRADGTTEGEGGHRVVVTPSGSTHRDDEAAATYDGSEAVTAETAAGDTPSPLSLRVAVPPPAPIAAAAGRIDDRTAKIIESSDTVPPSSSALLPSDHADFKEQATVVTPVQAVKPSRAPVFVGGAVAMLLLGAVLIGLLRAPPSQAPSPSQAPAPQAEDANRAESAVKPSPMPNSAPPTEAHALAHVVTDPVIAADSAEKQHAAPSAGLPPPLALTPTAAKAEAPVKAAAHPAESGRAAGPLPTEVVEAQEAFASGRLAEAERKATHSLLGSRNPQAFAVLAKIHCARGDLGSAKTWFGQTSGAAKADAKRYCASQGIAL